MSGGMKLLVLHSLSVFFGTCCVTSSIISANWCMYKKVALPSFSNHSKVNKGADAGGTQTAMQGQWAACFPLNLQISFGIYLRSSAMYLMLLTVHTKVSSGCCNACLLGCSSRRGQRYFMCFWASIECICHGHVFIVQKTVVLLATF